MNPIALATTTGRYAPALRTTTGVAVILDGTFRTYASAAGAADHQLRTVLKQAADLIAADAGWWRGWEAAHAEAKALMEGAPCLPDAAMLAEMVLDLLPAEG